jgi:hypothetical protein
MNISINEESSRTLAPQISMDADSYQISGVGPDGSIIDLLSTEKQNLVEDLTIGDWFIVIEALNADGTIIGYGSGTVTVSGGETVTAYIAVTPLEGTGTLDLSVTWETADVVNPVVSAKLITDSGAETILAFSSSASGSSSCSTTISTGYYTLILQLLDTETVVMGSVETVRIVADQTTYGTFDFTEVNSIGGTIDIEIDVDMENPIEVSLSGTVETLPMGSSMSITASAPLETISVSYFWYVNGSSAGIGSTQSIGSTLSPGIYRLDVIALNSDGSRSGSQNHTFTVTN